MYRHGTTEDSEDIIIVSRKHVLTTVTGNETTKSALWNLFDVLTVKKVTGIQCGVVLVLVY